MLSYPFFNHRGTGVPFVVDHRISSTCFALGDWPLSRVFLKNNANYPWFILVPRQDGLTDIDQLSRHWRQVLMDEMSELSACVKAYFQPDKLNMGALGNIVSQLHIHVVARFTQDELWPHAIWQSAQTTTAYAEHQLEPLLEHFAHRVKSTSFDVSILG